MRITLAGFPAGELSPAIEGRTDIAALKQGCRLARNVIPQRLGGLWQRPGFQYRARTEQQEQPVRLLPFVAGPEASYVVEMGEGYMRFFYNNSGILTTADNVGRPGVISSVGEPLKLETPYLQGELRTVQFAGANDVMWLTHPLHLPQKLTRYASDSFGIAPMTFLFPPLRDENALEITLTASATTGSITITATGGDVFTSGDVGGYYGINHTRELPFAEYSLSNGSGTAVADLVFTGNAVAGETVTVGTGSNLRTYTWGSAGPYGVTVGATADDSINNLVLAINGESTANPGTIANGDVEAENLGSFAAAVKAAGILTFTDNDLTAGTPDKFIIGAQAYEFANSVTSGPAYRVLKGANLAASILNAIKAINASGVAGTDYTAGTVANTQVVADAAAVGNTLRVVAITAGSAGNAIATTVQDTSRMSWGSPTLTGGADSATNKMRVSARLQGTAGNLIATAETMTNAAWQPVGFLTGGSDTIPPEPIPTVRVNGTWEVYTLGRWSGVLTLEQQRSTGEWETVRTWESQNDRNVNATGETNGEKVMRLVFVGSGVLDDLAPARATLTATDAEVRGLVQITGYISPTQVTAMVLRELWSTEPTYQWSEGAWSERRGYPASVTLHEQRLVFGKGITVVGSQTGGFDNFERNILADASYSYDLAATTNADIVGLQSQNGLIILTEAGEWLMNGGGTNQPITPMQVYTAQLSAYGSAGVQPELIHNNVVFVQYGNQILNEYQFQFANQNYEAINLTELVDHLGDERIIQVQWAPVPHSLIWAITDQGSLLSLAYRRGAGMLAWTKHSTPYGAFESICSIPGIGGITDVWVSVVRTLPGSPTAIRTLESFGIDYWDLLRDAGEDDRSRLCVMDGATKEENVSGVGSVTGLDWLEGATVEVLGDGCVMGSRVVTGGTVIVTNESRKPRIVIVGLAPEVLIQPMYLDVGLRDGASTSRKFRIAKINPRFYRTGACKYSDEEGKQEYVVNMRTAQDSTGISEPLYDGLFRLDLAGGYLDETLFRLINQGPLPLNVLNVTLELVITG